MTQTPVFSRAAVAAPHALAAETGRAILAEGGNAVEAMIAMAATIAVVYPHMNAIGGDGFWLIREPGGKVRAIEACGPAGEGATVARYRKAGHDTIPTRGADAALTVAGAVGGWSVAQELATTYRGRLPRDVLMSDAIRHAREGVAVSPSEARTVPNALAELAKAPGFAAAFLEDGKVPAAGTLRRAPVLSATLAQLAHAGFDDFYRGDIGREIGADLERIGAPVTRGDLQAYRARQVRPLSLRLPGGLTLFNMPPPTQGLASLIILGIFARLGVSRGEGFAHIHGLVEATKRAFRIRDAVVTDPAYLRFDPDDYLTDTRLAKEAAAVVGDRAAEFPLAWGEGDTVWMGAIDATGFAVSYIQSTYWEYGSGCVLPATGVLWQNRGIAFSLDEGAVNPLRPGRKPFHTLNPPLAVADDGRVISYGSMGGDGQPQFQATVLSRYLFGMGPAEAVDAPRFLLGKTWGSASTSLKLENRFDPALVRQLERAGHVVEELPDGYSDTLGHAGLLVRSARDGAVMATHDPRSDGAAAGL